MKLGRNACSVTTVWPTIPASASMFARRYWDRGARANMLAATKFT